MKFIAEIDIMPRSELLDPQGRAIRKNIHKVDIIGVEDVRIGKHIRMTLDAESEAEASTKVDEACKKLLANAIVETYTFEIKSIEN